MKALKAILNRIFTPKMNAGIQKAELQSLYPVLFEKDSGYVLEFSESDYLIRAQWINPLAPTKKENDPLYDLRYKSPTLKLDSSGGSFGGNRYFLDKKLAIDSSSDKEGPFEVRKICEFDVWIKEHLQTLIKIQKLLDGVFDSK